MKFTRENAREMAARGNAAIRERKALGATIAQPTSNAPDPYVVARLARVRRQLNAVDALVLAEQDPQRLDRLASAQARLSEQERILSGRPLPGSHKPTAPGKVRRGPSAEGPIGLAPGS